MQKIALVVILFILLVFSSAEAQTEIQNDYLIVPGERVGNIRLGQNVRNSVQILGEPDIIIEDGPSHYYEFTSEGIVLRVCPETQAVNGITTNNIQYRLATGVGPGTPVDELIEEFPEFSPETKEDYSFFREYYYPEDNIMFRTYEDDVYTISITIPIF